MHNLYPKGWKRKYFLKRIRYHSEDNDNRDSCLSMMGLSYENR